MLVHIYGAFHDAPSVRLAGGQMKGWKEGQVGHNSCRSEAGRWTTLAFSILIFVFLSKYCLALSCPGRPNTQTMAELRSQPKSFLQFAELLLLLLTETSR